MDVVDGGVVEGQREAWVGPSLGVSRATSDATSDSGNIALWEDVEDGAVVPIKKIGCPGEAKYFLRGKREKGWAGHGWKWWAEMGAEWDACDNARRVGAEQAEKIAKNHSCEKDNCHPLFEFCEGPTGTWEPFGDIGGMRFGLTGCVVTTEGWYSCGAWCMINGEVTITCDCYCNLYPWNW